MRLADPFLGHLDVLGAAAAGLGTADEAADDGHLRVQHCGQRGEGLFELVLEIDDVGDRCFHRRRGGQEGRAFVGGRADGGGQRGGDACQLEVQPGVEVFGGLRNEVRDDGVAHVFVFFVGWKKRSGRRLARACPHEMPPAGDIPNRRIEVRVRHWEGLTGVQLYPSV